MKYGPLVLLNIALVLGRPTPVAAAGTSYRAIFDAPPARGAAFGWHTWTWARLQANTGKSQVF